MADLLPPFDPELGPYVTGVGSLPFLDVDEAIAFVTQHCPAAPFWPQLPQRSDAEGMVAQVLTGAPMPLTWKDGRLVESPDREEPARLIDWMDSADPAPATERSSGYRAFREAFVSEHFQRARVVKAQLAGPWTVLNTVMQVRPEDQLTEHLRVCSEYIGRLARHMAKLIREAAPNGCGALITIDEPIVPDGPSSCDYLRGVISEIRQEGAAAGVHCCGQPPFDDLVTQDPDLLSFDALSYGDAFFESDAAREWLSRGGRIAAGLAPTDRGLSQSEASLAAKEWLGRGEASPNPIPWAVTATCGLGLRSTPIAHQVFESTTRIANAFR